MQAVKSSVGLGCGPSQRPSLWGAAAAVGQHSGCQSQRCRLARNIQCQGSRDGKSLRSAGSSTNFQVPGQLLKSDYLQSGVKSEDPLTVYTIRLTTGFARGAAISDDNSGVNVCLLGQNGQAVLHRVSPVNDHQEAQAQVKQICQLIDDQVGANCSVVLNPPTGTSAVPRAPPPVKRRFQEGSVDEVVFLGPELGPLTGVLVGTESGSWYLDEMDVSSSRTNHIDRFVCRRLLGTSVGQGAAFMTTVALGSVVYGEGDSAVVLSKEQASSLQALNMAEYEDFKKRLLRTTTILVACGGSVAAISLGLQIASFFWAGGMAGVLYQWMLMQGVDHVVEAAAAPTASPRPAALLRRGSIPTSARRATSVPVEATNGLRRVVGSAPVRLAFICSAAAALVAQGLQGSIDVVEGEMVASSETMWELLMATLGFLTYKVALVSVTLAPGTAVVAGQKVKATTKAFEKGPK